MDILGKLFSSDALVKIMRLFLLHPHQPFENKEILERSRVTPQALKTEIAILKKINFIKKKTYTKTIPPRGKQGKPGKKKVVGWVLNREFEHLYPLKLLLLNPDSVNRKEMLNRVKTAGTIKLVVLSGIFLREDNSRVDMLIVGNRLKKKALENALKAIESEVGKELAYSIMETEEFVYRLGMYDKFIRDILDYPHERLVDKIGIDAK